MYPFKLENNYFIQGFERYSEVFDKVLQLGGEQNVLFKGKTLDVKEDIACLCVEHNIQRCKYKNYNPDTFKPDGIKMQGFNYAVLSIQSTCEAKYKYCVIYKGQQFQRIIDKQYIKDKAEFQDNKEKHKIEYTLNKVEKGIIIIGAGPVGRLILHNTELSNIGNNRVIEKNHEDIDLTLSDFTENMHNDLFKKVDKIRTENKKPFKPQKKERNSNMFDSRSECGKSKIRKMR